MTNIIFEPVTKYNRLNLINRQRRCELVTSCHRLSAVAKIATESVTKCNQLTFDNFISYRAILGNCFHLR